LVAEKEMLDLVLKDVGDGEYIVVAGLLVPFGLDGLSDDFTAMLTVSRP